MTHFAKLDANNVVVFVTKGRQEDHNRESELSARTGTIYKQTSYNTRGGVHYDPNTNLPSENQSKAFRKNFASVGYVYDAMRDAFIPPKRYESWVLDETTCLWKAPIDMPDDGKEYVWDEANQQWVEVTNGS